MRGLLAFSRVVDWFNSQFAVVANWLVLLAALISAGNAGSRYLFSESSNGWLEIQWYMFAGMVLLGAPYTLKMNEHVRVDLVYGMVSERTRIWIDIVGGVLFLLPICVILTYFTWPWFVESWKLNEASSNAGGLLLSATRDRLLDAAELPPSSFLLTDTLALLLGIYATWRRRANLAILLGLGVAPLLMLALYSMNHRYRMEFDPLFTLLGLLGAATLLRAPQPLRSGMRRALIAATIIGMLGSQATLALYQRSPFGPGTPRMMIHLFDAPRAPIIRMSLYGWVR